MAGDEPVFGDPCTATAYVAPVHSGLALELGGELGVAHGTAPPMNAPPGVAAAMIAAICSGV